MFVSVINAICLLFCLGKCFVNVFRNYLSVKLFLQTKRHACEYEFLHELQIISNVGVTDKYARKYLIRAVAIGRGVFSCIFGKIVICPEKFGGKKLISD